MKKRKTIGLFVATVEDVFTNEICNGAMKAAAEKDVNLIIFPGKYLNKYSGNDDMQMYEYQYNTLFHYCYPESLDALAICVGSICCRSGLEARDRILRMAHGVPVICIASKEEGYCNIQYDNKSGIYDAIRYLVEEQHCTNIGMVGGTLDNDDSLERIAAFQTAIKENGLEADEDKIVYGDFTAQCHEVIEELLDRNPELDAIFCANDYMAKATYEVLAKRGIDVGHDIKIIGFDDITDCTKMNPPLSSIRTDASELGYQAICKGMTMSADSAKEDVVLETQFIPRESAGFRTYDMRELIGNFDSLSEDTFDIKVICDNVTEFVFRNVQHDYQADCQKKVLWTFINRLLGRFFGGIIKRNSIDEIYVFFENMVERGILIYTEPRKLVQVFDTIYQIYCTKNKILSNRLDFHNLLERMQQKVMEWMSIEIARTEKKQAVISHMMNYITRDILMFSNEAEENYAHSLEKMNDLNIKNGYLYVWETPKVYQGNHSWCPPEFILLKAYHKNGKVYGVPRTKQKIPINQLCSNNFFKKEERYTYVMLDLFSQAEQLGLYICDISYELFPYIEFLAYQLSSAVRTINLFQIQKVTQKMLEETLEKLQANNIELGTISNSDELTGVRNRRGFYAGAEALLKENPSNYYIVGYVDMDKLKMVNDTYGHDEGDFAIRSCASILTEAFGSSAVVGRIGGDEFAVMIHQDKRNQIQYFRNRIEMITEQLNQQVKKPYRIGLSVGMREFAYYDGLEIKSMIDEADDLLYEEKKQKKKSLA